MTPTATPPNSGPAPARATLRRRVGRLLRGALIRARNARARIPAEQLFVFGNQKSGTTAIAALLAEYAGRSVTLDITTWTAEEQDALHAGSMDFSEFVAHHRWEFARELIKEPALTLLYPEVARTFHPAHQLFIVRDPRDNIRSILNRVACPGNLERSPDLSALPVAWQRIVDNRWLGIEYDHYVESLAARWNHMAGVYLQQPEAFILIRYEDFLADKTGTIARVASEVGWTQRQDIAQRVDIPFQPRGDRDVAWADFFGSANLARIARICGPGVTRFGYPIHEERHA